MRASPANPARFNGVMGSSNYGYRLIPVHALSFGIGTQNTEAHGRNTQTMYTTLIEEMPFGITLQWSNQEEYRDMFDWLRAWAYRVTDPDGSVGPMQVVIPSRNFSKTGIPQSGMTFGDQVDAVTYSMQLQFEAAGEPITSGSGATDPYWSQFVLPSADPTQQAPYFYPGGVQLGASYANEDALYNDTVGPTLPDLSGVGNGRGLIGGI